MDEYTLGVLKGTLKFDLSAAETKKLSAFTGQLGNLQGVLNNISRARIAPNVQASGVQELLGHLEAARASLAEMEAIKPGQMFTPVKKDIMELAKQLQSIKNLDINTSQAQTKLKSLQSLMRFIKTDLTELQKQHGSSRVSVGSGSLGKELGGAAGALGASMEHTQRIQEQQALQREAKRQQRLKEGQKRMLERTRMIAGHQVEADVTAGKFLTSPIITSKAAIRQSRAKRGAKESTRLMAEAEAMKKFDPEGANVKFDMAIKKARTATKEFEKAKNAVGARIPKDGWLNMFVRNLPTIGRYMNMLSKQGLKAGSAGLAAGAATAAFGVFAGNQGQGITAVKGAFETIKSAADDIIFLQNKDFYTNLLTGLADDLKDASGQTQSASLAALQLVGAAPSILSAYLKVKTLNTSSGVGEAPNTVAALGPVGSASFAGVASLYKIGASEYGWLTNLPTLLSSYPSVFGALNGRTTLGGFTNGR